MKRNNSAPPQKRGTKPKPIDLAMVRQLAAIQCTYEEIASVMSLKKRQFIDRIKADAELRTAIDEGWESGRASIRRQQFRLLEAGNATMAVWLGKQYLGQRDNLDTKLTGSGPNGELELNPVSEGELIRRDLARIAARSRPGSDSQKP